MRIRGIAVEGVGMFDVPTRIEGLGPGVNILSAGNEAGKSTIFKAIRACLFERHNTKNRDVAALATDGLSLPVTVSLDFQHDGGLYELTKSFVRSPSARLRRDGKDIALGREADEAAWKLLGIEPGSGRSVDEAAFALLWVGQGKSFGVPQPTGAVPTALNEAIQGEVSELVGGERARAARIDQDRQELQGLQAELGPLTERETDARDNIKSAETAIAEIDADEEKRQHRLNKVDRIFGAVERFGQRPQLERRAEKLRKLQEELGQNRAALSENRATAEAVEKVNGLELDLDRLTGRMEAAAPQVEIALGESAAGQVWIGEEELAENRSLHVTEPLEIRVGELATITVSPPAGTRKNDQKKLKRLRTELQQLLGDVGAKTPADVNAAHARRLQLERNRQGLEARMTALDTTEADLAAKAEETRAELEQVDGLVRRILEEYNLDALPSPGQIESEQQALCDLAVEALRKRKTLEGTLAAQNDNLNETVEKLGDARGTQRTIQRRVEGDLAVLPDADRERLTSEVREAFEIADQEYGRKAAALGELRRQAPSDEEMERRRLQFGRIEQSLTNRQAQIADLNEAIAKLEGGIETEGGDGLGEKEQTLREQRDLASREVARHERRIATLQLLKEMIEDCYEDQRERLHAPLLRHLRPFLHDIFPSAELKLGDGFVVQGLKREGPAPENFERLSDGTKEQIAALVRLAMGALLCERGQEVPIILDDALVFSDDTRIEQMFNALTRAGKNQQVIVFTCRTRTFETLGGRPLSIAHHVA